MKNKCPDFSLAPLIDLPLDFFQHNNDKNLNQLKSLTLTFAMIYNDFKSYMWMHYQLEKGKPIKMAINPYCGQWSGFNIHLGKVFSSILLEYSKLIAKNYQFLTKPYVVNNITSKLGPSAKNCWDELIKLGAPKKKRSIFGKSNLYNVLKSIRNKINSHYDYESNTAYNGYLFWIDKIKSSKKLYYSAGDDLEQTRFYFGDICAEGVIKKSCLEENVNKEELYNEVKKLSEGLRFFIEYSVKYIKTQSHN